MDQNFAGNPITPQMLETPTRRAHRRAQSETFFRFPDFDEDMLLDDVVADFNLDLSSSSSDNQPHQLKFREPKEASHVSHFRSLSVDADFFAGLEFGVVDPPAAGGLRHSNSMDGSSTTTTSFEAAVDSTKKAMAPDKLAELALIDPKRAKRILANRQSAARSKDRKTRYTGELERKVQTLQGEATTLSAQVTKLQRDTSGLTTENKELALRLHAMEQEAHLRDALNDALREELKRLKIAAGEVQVDNGNNAPLHPQFSSHRSPFNSFNTAQTQYVQQQQQELHRSRPTSANTDPRGQLRPNFPGFNQRA